jgi:hypothetical protein
MAAILHGLNDWSRVNGHPVWILVTILSGVLFLGYAKVGARGDVDAPDPGLRPLWPHQHPPEHAPGPPAGQPPVPRQPAPGVPAGSRPRRPWWEH